MYYFLEICFAKLYGLCEPRQSSDCTFISQSIQLIAYKGSENI